MQNKIIDLFLSDYSVSEISKKLDIDSKEVYSIIKSHSIKRNVKNLSDNIKSKIITLYKNGITANKIAKDYVMSNHTVAKIIDMNNIPRRSKTGVRIYSLDETYFDSIDTPNKAYILGLFYADGNNSPQKSTISISLQEEDKEILEKIRHEIKYQKPLVFIDYSNKHDGDYTYKNQYKLDIFSSHFCHVLSEYGMIPNKSLILKAPTFLKEEFYPHFIRGYFDGDGHVSHKNKNNNCVTIVSTNEICVWMQKIISEYVGIKSHIYDAQNKNGITKYVGVYGRLQVIKFLDYLYKNADMYLERKYNIYLYEYKESTYQIA